MIYRHSSAIIPLLFLILTSCSTPGSVRQSDPGKTAVFHNVTKKQVFTTTARVMSRQLNILQYDLLLGVIKTESRANLMNWGEIVAAFINESASGTIELKVVSNTRSRFQFGGRDWAAAIINGVKIELNQVENVKSGNGQTPGSD